MKNSSQPKMISLFNGLYLDIEKSPSPLRDVPYLNDGSFEVRVVFGKYQLDYEGTMIWEIYTKGKQSVIEFLCCYNSHAIFKALQATIEVVMPSFKIKSLGCGTWTLEEQ